ncbi:hypothetical protein ODJ79_07385 [Actinoplanes sp. KI2]|uniref:hypothetical protein n=1 Tax=Actinoplanes sp. KI2 TaxID=2983315 RepID=UPI0021D5A902|nr:hypothetical protein [Actinoplanes sp. KI2]MCU7723530.1 hypothetical protein [Actinoplanes sp. KI2]
MNPSQESAPTPEPAQHSGPPADPAAAGPGGPAYDGTADPSYGDEGGPEVYGLAAESGGYVLAHPTGPEPVAYAGFGARWWGMAGTSHRPWRRTAVVSVLSAVVILLLGVPLGLLWAWLAPSVPVVATGDSIVVNDPSPEQYIAADGWYTLLGLGFGLLVAVVAWLLLRRDRGPFLLLGVVAGTLGAGFYVAPWIGEMIGRSGYEHWRDIATKGATYMAPPEVHSTGPKLVSAFAAAIVLTLLAGWSNDPDLDQPGAKPGYGPNAAMAEPYDETLDPGHDETLDPEPAHPQAPAEPPRT